MRKAPSGMMCTPESQVTTQQCIVQIAAAMGGTRRALATGGVSPPCERLLGHYRPVLAERRTPGIGHRTAHRGRGRAHGGGSVFISASRLLVERPGGLLLRLQSLPRIVMARASAWALRVVASPRSGVTIHAGGLQLWLRRRHGQYASSVHAVLVTKFGMVYCISSIRLICV